MGELITFYVLAGIVSFSALMVITQKNPVTAAIFLVGCLFFMAGIYALQGAEFIAAIQVIIYAGAILVLFIFVIMLLNLDPKKLNKKSKNSSLEYFAIFVLTLGFFSLILRNLSSEPKQLWDIPLQFDVDNTFVLGMHLFTNFLWPFELASILILLAIVASIVIAKKDKPKVFLK